MRKKIFSLLLVFCVILPCAFLFVACGEMKSVSGKTFVFSSVEVLGSENKAEVESMYSDVVISFTDGEITIGEDTYEYKLENKKIYLKVDDTYSTDAYLEISGSYLKKKIDNNVTVYLKVR